MHSLHHPVGPGKGFREQCFEGNNWWVQSFWDALQKAVIFWDYVSDHLLSSGWYGDSEKADESLLPNVSALSEQHQHCSQRTGGIMNMEFICVTILQSCVYKTVVNSLVFILGLHHTMRFAVDLQSPNYVFRPGTTWASGLYTRLVFAGRAAQFHPRSCLHWSGWWQHQHRSESSTHYSYV